MVYSWAPIKKVIQPLQRVQNSAASLIFRAPFRQPTTPLLYQLHWLPVSERIKYKIGCICFHVVNGTAPSYISEILPRKQTLPSLRSANDTRLLEAGAYKRKRQGYRALSFYGPFFWNELPHAIRHCQTLSYFNSKYFAVTSLSGFEMKCSLFFADTLCPAGRFDTM